MVVAKNDQNKYETFSWRFSLREFIRTWINSVTLSHAKVSWNWLFSDNFIHYNCSINSLQIRWSVQVKILNETRMLENFISTYPSEMRWEQQNNIVLKCIKDRFPSCFQALWLVYLVFFLQRNLACFSKQNCLNFIW